MKNQLAVEAFIDSLDDPEFEVNVKDRFPKDLADAFRIALMLEANRPLRTKNREQVDKAQPEAKGKARGRYAGKRIDCSG